MRAIDLEEPIDFVVAARRYLCLGTAAARRLANRAGIPKRYRYYQDSHNRQRRVRVIFPSEIARMQEVRFGPGIYKEE